MSLNEGKKDNTPVVKSIHDEENSESSFISTTAPHSPRSKQRLKELNDLIVKSRITTLEDTKDGNMFCCDGAVKTIILYHNGNRNYFKAMFEPRLVLELIGFLYKIDEKAELTSTDEKFEFEK